MSGLEVFTVYERPDDFPHSFVVRRAVVLPGGEIVQDKEPLCVSADLDEVLAAIPPGRVRLARDPNDVPSIREVWL